MTRPPRYSTASDTPLEKGPNGYNLCRECKTECSGNRQRTFCSQECVDKWNLIRSGALIRRALLERDKGLCAKCGIDVVSAEQERKEFLSSCWGFVRFGMEAKLELFYRKYPWAFKKKGATLVERLRRGTLWEADHIVEVRDGGGACGLENFQILCIGCHVSKTGARTREEARARQKALRGQLEFDLKEGADPK